ncbi:hypothetical protein [Anaerobaca lacustris]|uniref:DUF4276 family protein n=1 Tax=Anaerobaca lacustris TaxID=3044600 RepID=A0AAW6TWT8_9BACT|nr:hypothetical protein [Sedimentisphaerales bacterium M17dextr]
MKIGYSVEGSTDRAVLEGLRNRWCPHAQLIEGRFRGTSGKSQHREIPKTCIELMAKGVDLIVFLRDANNEDWRDVLKGDKDRCRSEHNHLIVFGVCDRNIECWLCTDANWIAGQTQHQPGKFTVADPKGPFEKAMSITGFDRKEEEIAMLVQRAPLRQWLGNPSFKEFYERLRDKSQQMGCTIENLLDN